MVGAEDAVWPLTGRDGELAEIDAALRAASGVLLAGQAGVGKTRLAREALARRPAGPARWLTATGSAQGVPLAALTPLLGPSDGEPDGASLLVRAHAALRSEPGLVLGVDDAHRLDDVSATLLHKRRSITRCGSWSRCVPAKTRRTPSPRFGKMDGSPASTWRRCPCRRPACWLGRYSAGGWTATAPGGCTTPRPATRCGCATWSTASCSTAGSAGPPAFGGGTACPGSARRSRRSSTRRSASCPPGWRRSWNCWRWGEPLGVGLLTDLIGGLEVEEAAARKLVAVQAEPPGTAARLAYPLYGEAVLNRCGLVRARRRRGQLVAALAGSGDRDAGDILRLAVLALDSDREPDPALFAAAASAAAEVTDVKLAERLARAACETGGGFEVRLLLGLLLSWQCKTQEAAREYALATDAAITNADRVRVAYCLAFNHLVLGQAQETWAVLDAVALGSPQAERQLLAFHAVLIGLENRLAEAEAVARQVLAMADRSSQAETYAGWVLSVALPLAGRLTETRETATRAVAAALRAPETAALQLNIRYWEVLALALAGLPNELRGYVDGLRVHLTGQLRDIFLSVFDGWHALVSGRVWPAGALLAEFRPHLPGTAAGGPR